MRIFVIGDIHGCIEALKNVLDKANFDFTNDKLILIGDLCDRGPDTWAVIDFLMKIEKLIFVIGNHDMYFRDYLRGDEWYIHNWGSNYGKITLESYEKRNWKDIDAHKKFLESAISYHVENNICFVHGSFDRDTPISIQNEVTLCSDRQLAYYTINSINNNEPICNFDNFNKIFIGHTPTIMWDVGEENNLEQLMNGKMKLKLKIDNPITYPIIKNGVYMIDTGCGKNGFLTLYDVGNDIYYQNDKETINK